MCQIHTEFPCLPPNCFLFQFALNFFSPLKRPNLVFPSQYRYYLLFFINIVSLKQLCSWLCMLQCIGSRNVLIIITHFCLWKACWLWLCSTTHTHVRTNGKVWRKYLQRGRAYTRARTQSLSNRIFARLTLWLRTLCSLKLHPPLLPDVVHLFSQCIYS